MNSLWVKLSLAFSWVILMFVLVVTTTAFLLLRMSGQTPTLLMGGSPSAQVVTLGPGNPDGDGELHAQAIVGMASALLRLALGSLLFGVPMGIWVSRSLASPLHDLAEAARAIGHGDLGQRVRPRGSQELIDVGTAFNQMAGELEKAAEHRRNLMADVAHELRTPLTVVQGNLRAILDDVYVMDKEEVARLYDHTRHLTQLVEDLRVVALAEAHQLPLHLELVEVAPLLTEIWAGFEPIAAEKGVALDLSLPKSALTVRVDAARLKQVMHNLLSNALRHTPTGGDITIAAGNGGSAVTITVTDTGEGIKPQHLAHVFDRFYRGDPARARDTGGAGLGLAIVKAIVEAHHGEVSAASSGPGCGAVVAIRLPRAEQV